MAPASCHARAARLHPLVWSVLGGLSVKTERMSIVTTVTCPTIRLHPAIVAQAAATPGACP